MSWFSFSSLLNFCSPSQSIASDFSTRSLLAPSFSVHFFSSFVGVFEKRNDDNFFVGFLAMFLLGTETASGGRAEEVDEVRFKD